MLEAKVEYNIDDREIIVKMNRHVAYVMNRDNNDEYNDGTHLDTQANMIILASFVECLLILDSRLMLLFSLKRSW